MENQMGNRKTSETWDCVSLGRLKAYYAICLSIGSYKKSGFLVGSTYSGEKPAEEPAAEAAV